jgi:anti-sigma B factor antagonist
VKATTPGSHTDTSSAGAAKRAALTVTTTTTGGGALVTLNGTLDVLTARQLRQTLLALADAQVSSVVVDLTEVTGLDSAGLGVLVGAQHRARLTGGVLRLVATGEPVSTVLRLTGLGRFFDVHPDAKHALDSSTREA